MLDQQTMPPYFAFFLSSCAFCFVLSLVCFGLFCTVLSCSGGSCFPLFPFYRLAFLPHHPLALVALFCLAWPCPDLFVMPPYEVFLFPVTRAPCSRRLFFVFSREFRVVRMLLCTCFSLTCAQNPALWGAVLYILGRIIFSLLCHGFVATGARFMGKGYCEKQQQHQQQQTPFDLTCFV